MSAAKVKWTEATLLELLRERHNRPGNGGSGEYAFMAHVRDAAGFDARRTFDAVTVSLWPSRGLEIHVWEVKTSRSDWRRELKDPAKAERACEVGDRFSVVAPAGVVKEGELPAPWGLLEATCGDKGARLREKVAAPLLSDRGRTSDRPVSRGLLVSMLRCCPGAIPGGKVPAPTQVELNAEYQRGHKAGEASMRQTAKLAGERHTQLQSDVTELRNALQSRGLSQWESTPVALAAHAEVIVRAIKDGQATRQLDQARRVLRAALEQLDAAS